MSRGLNKVQIIGRLGRDPEMRYTSNGTPVTTFSVATGGKWTDRNGVERDDTEWFRVDAWDRLAETCNQYLTKGREVYIEGRIKTEKYTDRDGNERTAVKLVANNMVMLGGKGDNSPPYSGSDDQYSDDEDEEGSSSRSLPRKSSTQRPAGRNQPQPVSESGDVGEDDIPF